MKKRKRNKGYSKVKQAEIEATIRDLIGRSYSDATVFISLTGVIGQRNKHFLTDWVLSDGFWSMLRRGSKKFCGTPGIDKHVQLIFKIL